MREALTTVQILVVISLSACAPEPLVFPDWTIPVPESTPIIEYPAVPLEERTERIELVEDLVIGSQEDLQCTLYRPTDVVAGPNGRIYVADEGNHSVHVFSELGDCLFTIGREGEGPGEFKRPRLLAIAGDVLAVSDGVRLSTWTLDGEHLGDHRRESSQGFLNLAGSGPGSLVATYQASQAADGFVEALSGHSIDGRQTVEYATVALIGPEPFDPTMNMQIWMVQGFVNGESGPRMAFAVGALGSVHVTPLDEYQMLRMTPSGEVSWALRVAWQRAAYNEELIDMRLRHLRTLHPEAKRSDVAWPDRQRALGALRIDGHGHLFAFPIIKFPPGDTDGDKPVDVYSSDGERLFSGFISDLWDTAHGDFVYKLRLNDETEEHEIVRYLLVEPF